MTAMNIIGKRKIWYAISLVILLPGLVFLMLQGLNLGIDFVGGTVMQVKFEQQIAMDDLRNELNAQGLTNSKIQLMDDDSYQIKTAELEQDAQDKVITALETELGTMELLKSELVGPSIGSELTRSGFIALGLAIILMIAYITYRFEMHFAIAGILALLHDVLIVVAVFAFLQLEVDSTFIAAVLTIFGYSINDKIVVFDRIRENLGSVKKEELAGLVNSSIKQSFTRSMNTSASTLILLLALFIFGGQTTKIFVLAMIIGIVAGTYSSLCIASPLWYEFKMHTKGKRVEAKR